LHFVVVECKEPVIRNALQLLDSFPMVEPFLELNKVLDDIAASDVSTTKVHPKELHISKINRLLQAFMKSTHKLSAVLWPRNHTDIKIVGKYYCGI